VCGIDGAGSEREHQETERAARCDAGIWMGEHGIPQLCDRGQGACDRRIHAETLSRHGHAAPIKHVDRAMPPRYDDNPG
jgi:hypothetical protein